MRERAADGRDVAHAHVRKRAQRARDHRPVACHVRRALQRRQRRHRADAQLAVGRRRSCPGRARRRLTSRVGRSTPAFIISISAVPPDIGRTLPSRKTSTPRTPRQACAARPVRRDSGPCSSASILSVLPFRAHRRKRMFRTLLLCVALIFPTLVHGAGRADPHRLPDGAHRPARRRRQADGARHPALPQGAEQHLAGRKVEIIFADTGGKPARREDQDPGARRARQGARHHRAARRLRGARHRRLHVSQRRRSLPPCSAAQKTSPSASQTTTIYALRHPGQPNHALGDYAAKKLGIQARRDDRRRLHLRPRERRRLPARVRGQRRQASCRSSAAAQRRRTTAPHRPAQDQRRRGLRRLRRRESASGSSRLQRVRLEDAGARQ